MLLCREGRKEGRGEWSDLTTRTKGEGERTARRFRGLRQSHATDYDKRSGAVEIFGTVERMVVCPNSKIGSNLASKFESDQKLVLN